MLFAGGSTAAPLSRMRIASRAHGGFTPPHSNIGDFKKKSAGSYVRVQTRKTAAGVSKQRNVIQNGGIGSCMPHVPHALERGSARRAVD